MTKYSIVILLSIALIANCNSNSTDFVERSDSISKPQADPIEDVIPPQEESIPDNQEIETPLPSIKITATQGNELFEVITENIASVEYSNPFIVANDFSKSADEFCEEMLFSSKIIEKANLGEFFQKQGVCNSFQFRLCIRSKASETDAEFSYTFSPSSDLTIQCPQEFFNLVQLDASFKPDSLNTDTIDLNFDNAGFLIQEIYISNVSCEEGGEWRSFTNSIENWEPNWNNTNSTDIFIKYKDQHANESTCFTEQISLITGSLSINNDNAVTNSREVLLQLEAPDATQVYLTPESDCSKGGTWQNIKPELPWLITEREEEFSFDTTVYAVFKDANNHLSRCLSAQIQYSHITPSELSMSIDSNADYSLDSEVEITFSALNASEMYLTNSNECADGGAWEDFVTVKTFQLPNENAQNTIYAKFKSADQTESECINASIYYDTQEPAVTIEQGASQSDPALSFPISYDIQFSEAINPETFDISDITQTGTATGVDFELSSSTDNKSFVLTVTNTSSMGTIIPSIATEAFSDLAGRANSLASQSIDNNVSYGIPLTVEARFSAASNWNDYIKTPTYSDATEDDNFDQICADKPSELDRPTDCAHGGEHRKVTIAGITSCDGLSLSDELDAFYWKCEVVSSLATFYSFGFKPGKGLGDLLDPTAFKNNKVTLSGSAIGQSESTTWWTNPIENLTQPGTNAKIDLAEESKIYTVSSNISSAGFTVSNHKVALVILPGFRFTYLDNNGSSDNCNRPFGDDCILGTRGNATKYGHIWIEGDYLASGAYAGFDIPAGTLYHSRLHRLRVASAGYYGLYGPGEATVITDSSFNNNTTYGMYITGEQSPNISAHALLKDIVMTNNGQTSFGGGMGVGIYIRFNIINSILTNNLEPHAVRDYVSNQNTLVNTTAVHNRRGVYIDNDRNTLLNIASYNESGVMVWKVDNTLSQLMVSPDGWRIYAPSGNNNWTGNTISDGGMMSTTPTISLDHNYSTLSTDIYSSFVGKITTDPINTGEDTDGKATFAAALDWGNFNNRHRTWSYDANFFSSTNSGRITSGLLQIWDWSLKSTDTFLRNTSGDAVNQNDPIAHDSACPSILDGTNTANLIEDRSNQSYYPGVNAVDGTDDTCETGESGCNNLYLMRATEIVLDLIGDDDGLCESNEACIYAPNFGAYQGHGDFSNNICNYPSASAEAGKVTGVTMHFYPANGR